MYLRISIQSNRPSLDTAEACTEAALEPADEPCESPDAPPSGSTDSTRRGSTDSMRNRSSLVAVPESTPLLVSPAVPLRNTGLVYPPLGRQGESMPTLIVRITNGLGIQPAANHLKTLEAAEAICGLAIQPGTSSVCQTLVERARLVVDFIEGRDPLNTTPVNARGAKPMQRLHTV